MGTLAEALIRNQNHNTIFAIEHLNYSLLPILRQLSMHGSRILVILNSSDQVKILTKELLPIDLVIDEEFIISSPSIFYDYLFFVGECFPKQWARFSRCLIVDLSMYHQKNFSDENVVILRNKINRHFVISYNDTNYSLDDLNDLFLAVAGIAARVAYAQPKSRILLLLPSITEVESLIAVLRQAQLQLPIITLDEYNNSPCIMVSIREVALLSASQLQPTYTIDTLLKKEWSTTWTQGRRQQYVQSSRSQADEALVLGGIIHRMISDDSYSRLPLTTTPKICIWREWLLHNHSNLPDKLPSFIKIKDLNPALTNYLLSTNLGLRPAILLWRWNTDGLPLFPMICLVAMIDSFGPPYFQYPLQTPGMDDGTYRRIRQQHGEKYFAPFFGWQGNGSEVDGDFSPANDLVMLMKIWNSLLLTAGSLENIPSYIQSWSQQNSMASNKIAEVYSLVSELVSYFDTEGFNTTQESLNLDDFVVQARPYIQDVYSEMLASQVADGSPTYLYNKGGVNSISMIRDGGEYSINTFENPRQLYVIVASDEKVGNTTRRIIWIALPGKEEGEPDGEDPEIVIVPGFDKTANV